MYIYLYVLIIILINFLKMYNVFYEGYKLIMFILNENVIKNVLIVNLYKIRYI